ncbi:MAG TPA: WD40 repeat domain-containing protein, partial [Chitinophagaceae bacterium]|nr:WD40 repeat domain-containing protein [Chitinophagaceae bacterium]
MLPLGHTAGVSSAGFSPDGKRIITTDDKDAKIWDAATGALLKILKEPDDFIQSAQFSPDGKKIVSALYHYTTKIRDAVSGLLLQTFTGHKDIVYTAAFSPDGKKIITASQDNTAKIWDVVTGKLLISLESDSTYNIWTAEFSPDGKLVLTVSKDMTAKVWDASTGNLQLALKGKFIDDAHFSPDGKKIIAVCNQGIRSYIEIFDAFTGGSKINITVSDYFVKSAEYSPDGAKIITTSHDSTAKIWDAQTGTLVFTLKGHGDYLIGAKFSPDGKRVVTYSKDRTAKVWITQTGKLQAELKGHSEAYLSVKFSPDGKKIATSSYGDKPFEIIDAASYRVLHRLHGRLKFSFDIRFSSDGKKLVNVSEHIDAPIVKEHATGVDFIGGSRTKIMIWDSEKGIVLNDIEADPNKLFHTSAFSPDGKKIVLRSSYYPVKILNANTGKILTELKNSPGINSAEFNSDGKKIVTAGDDRSVKIWDANTGDLLNILFGYKDRVITARFTPDDGKIVTLSADSSIKIWDALTKTLLQSIVFPAKHNCIIKCSPDGNFIAIGADENLIVLDGKSHRELKRYSFDREKIIRDVSFETDVIVASGGPQLFFFDLSTGKYLNSAMIVDSADYFVQIPEGYYLSTPQAAKLLHYVTKDLKVITFEQLDVKYNRPDKVLEAIGNADTALIKSYRKAWEKRIKKLGIDTTQFRDGYSVPEADFVNRDSIAYEQKTGTLRLHIKGIDSTYKLDRFNVWVNESPLYGQRGISIRRKNSNKLDTVVTIKLSQGENRIETSITNVNGTESYRMPLYVNYTPAVKQKEMTRFIGIGIDQFKESRYNLQYSSKDIRDLAVKLKEKYKDNIIIDTLFNEDVTTEKVKALKQKLQQTTVNDKVIISYSGHGLLS